VSNVGVVSFFFSDDVDDTGDEWDGFACGPYSGISASSPGGNQLDVTMSGPADQGQHWSLDPGLTDVTFVSGLPLQPGSGTTT
jgi:hypothetical protein